jgi:hypothetical protein
MGLELLMSHLSRKPICIPEVSASLETKLHVEVLSCKLPESTHYGDYQAARQKKRDKAKDI